MFILVFHCKGKTATDNVPLIYDGIALTERERITIRQEIPARDTRERDEKENEAKGLGGIELHDTEILLSFEFNGSEKRVF